MQRRCTVSNIRSHAGGAGSTTRLDRFREAYFHWLVAQVRENRRHQPKTYWDLLELMHRKEFVWLVPNDDNRVADGCDLRLEFLHENGTHEHITKDDFGPCSVLEVLIALSRRLAWNATGAAEIWAWQLLDNLDLLGMSDPLSNRKARKVDEILETLIWRTYSPDGSGGFFPLIYPEQDQTKVEIWYQMHAYINELHPEYPRR